ncbi:MAG: serine protease [Enhygromyxa sp.]
MFDKRNLPGPWLHSYQGQLIDPQVTVTTPGQFGNGFFVSEWRDAVVTSAHVVQGANKVRVRARADGVEVWFDARTTAWEEGRDLAVVRLPARVKGFSKRLVVASPSPGGLTTTSLNGYGSLDAWRKGWLTREKPVRGNADGWWIEYLDGSSGGHGFSGSPVFDAQTGLVVGVHRGSPGGISNRASRVDMNIINALRNFTYADENL